MPLLSGSPGLATMFAVAGHCLPGSAFKPGSRGDAWSDCLGVSPDHNGVLDYLGLHMVGVGSPLSTVCSPENTWAVLSLRTGGFPTCRTRTADCDAAAVNKQQVPSCHPLAWVRKQAKFEGPEPPLRGRSSTLMELGVNVNT